MTYKEEPVERRPIAIIRIDGPKAEDHNATIKSFSRSTDEAVLEVERLNGVSRDGSRYVWCVARGLEELG